MKPYVTDAMKDGKFILEFQCEGNEGFEAEEFWRDREITAYGMPESHSFENAWLFRLYFENDYFVEFSSACTNVGGWREIGSLNLRFVRESTQKQMVDSTPFPKTTVNGFAVTAVNKLVYRENDLYAECGIVFSDLSGREVIVAAGVSPGSVSVLAPFSSGPFVPELRDHIRVPI